MSSKSVLAAGVRKEEADFVWLILGQLATAGVLTLVLNWQGANTAATGAKIGSLFGFLNALSIDLTMYGTTNINNLTATLVDPLVAAVLFAVTGAVIGTLLGRRAAL